VAVTAPNGGEVWAVGHDARHHLDRHRRGQGWGTVDLAYSRDGGATYPFAIATGIANTGTYSWPIPNDSTAFARVRVTARDIYGNTASDASDANFTIKPPNTPPRCSRACRGPRRSPEMAPYTFTATATDPDLPAQTLTFSLVGAPAGAAIDSSSGVFSWTPTEAQGPARTRSRCA
jgi:hypothetical protein